MSARSLVASIGSAIVLMAFAPSCSTEDIVLAKLPPSGEQGPGGEPHKCVESSDCSGRDYCAKRDCADIGGECEPRPIVCEEDPAPVCGCDGITYWNDCIRRTAGIATSTKGECMRNARICGGVPGPPPPPDQPPLPAPDPSVGGCPPNTYCARLQGPFPDAPEPQPPKCFGDTLGTCWALPAVCPPQGGPDRWIECGPAPGCVTTCEAIRSGIPHVRATQCP